MKTLVVYYSRSGTTRTVGEAIAEKLKCDKEEIIDMKKRRGVIGWLKAGKEGKQGKTTKIKPLAKKVNDYDLVIVGTPVWAGNMSPATRTFLEENKKDIKKTAFFATFGGSEGKTFQDMESICGVKPISNLGLKNGEVKKKEHLQKLGEFIKGMK
ncbi:MAG: NAD(P)H-dependent oxidoreductase [Candidatus Altiarchaeota archaeon]|nr:NAD(P)H-dependent oxidoreductase [Candidatus Altiarchaeota archaeon]